MSADLTATSAYTVLGPAQPAAATTAEATGAVGADVGVSLEIKRSEFIAYLQRVDSEAAARELIERTRKVHHDARHHCSAFLLGPDRGVQRSNDDGEPAGTAGVPMLDALRKRETSTGVTDLSDICAVVVRYFGGIKLGAGGLVRAYSDSVSAALDAARLIRREKLLNYTLEAPYDQVGRWENELRAAGYPVLGTDYAATTAVLTFGVSAAAGKVDAMETMIASLTAGAAQAELIGQQWVDVA
ncbi:IMPACT family protein [Micrococcoides hystricis]|uniref:IMPACT family protein n=1 Tax=Micrococcoides hystricis TaxID=1572761 RepID=A0ABV6P722_9MICC